MKQKRFKFLALGGFVIIGCLGTAQLFTIRAQELGASPVCYMEGPDGEVINLSELCDTSIENKQIPMQPIDILPPEIASQIPNEAIPYITEDMARQVVDALSNNLSVSPERQARIDALVDEKNVEYDEWLRERRAEGLPDPEIDGVVFVIPQ